MPEPRFFYFDLGNVLLHFDFNIACHRLAERTGLPRDTVDTILCQSGLQERFEQGELSAEQFASEVCRRGKIAMETAELLEICSAIFELNVAIVPVIAHLKASGHRLGILSNTCSAHWNHIFGDRYAVLRHSFERMILSYEVGAMKPSAQIYQAAVAAAGVPAQQIFFTDDRAENVAGAQLAGLDATHYRGTQALIDDLRARGVRLNL